jgi:hypothetical protein
MIFAASMGPTPKISVRVVPEASTSASMRPFRSATLFLSLQRPEFAQDLRSQLTAEPRRGALGPYTTQDTCGSAGRERPGYPAGDEVAQKPVCRLP